MKHFMYRLRRHHKWIKILGILFTILGSILILKIIPIKFYLFILGILLVVVGYCFLRIY